MTTPETELKKMAALAYLDIDTDNTHALANDIRAIMAFVGQLRDVDTTDARPLLHPLDLYQRLREDRVTDDNQTAALEHIAPSFSDGLYKVPKVL